MGVVTVVVVTPLTHARYDCTTPSTVVGKTRLVRDTLAPPVAAFGGYLLVGQFDSLRQGRPATEHVQGFVAAFAQFVDQVLQHDAVPIVRAALIKAGLVGHKDWQVLVG
jgi:hypothetical protein